jgi:DNA uptake protein ComE-like DNA-binding protein
MHQRGSVLVGVLWCLALLSLVVIGGLHTARLDLSLTRHQADRLQAHYLALAGAETAKAILFHDARERERARQPYAGALEDDPSRFRDVPLGRGRFRVIHGTDPEDGDRLMYGVRNEESRLNLNTASPEELSRLRDITPDLVAALVDWRDPDHQPSDGGAEQDYYLGLQPPTRPRNAPFASVRELLAVRGFFTEELFGSDRRANGLPPNENGDDGEDLPASPLAIAGWAHRLTTHSGVRNVNEAGEARLNLGSASESDLSALPGISTDLARAIVNHRNQNRFQNIADLLDVRAAPPPGTPSASPSPMPNPAANPRGAPSPGRPSPALPFPTGSAPGGTPTPGPSTPNPTPSGPPLIDETLLMDIAGDLTTSDQDQLNGVINVNTAGVEVLALLPGMTRELAQATVSYRRSSGAFPNEAALLQVPGITRDILRQLAPRVVVRAETFRILSEGFIPSTGVRRRLETIVRVGPQEVTTLAYREDHL